MPLDFIPFRNAQVPNTDQKIALLVSKATLENCRCHGETAKKKEVRSAISFFLNSSNTIRYVKITANEPNNAEGNLTAKSVKPNTTMDGTTKYVYKGGL